MTFENITTVQDLILSNEANKVLDEIREEREAEEALDEGSTEDVVMDVIMEAGWETGHSISQRLVQAAITLHEKYLHNAMEKMDSDEDKAYFALLNRDLIHLQAALTHLGEVS